MTDLKPIIPQKKEIFTMNQKSRSSSLLIRIGQSLRSDEKVASDHSGSEAEFDVIEAIHSVQSELADVKLADQDIQLIGAAYHRTVMRETPIPALELLKDVYDDPVARVENIDRIRHLVFRKIFEPMQKTVKRQNSSSYEVKLQLNRCNVFDLDVILHPDFLARLLDETNQKSKENDQPYSSNQEYLQDLFMRTDLMRNYNLAKTFKWNEASVMEALSDLSDWDNRIALRISKTDRVFPFQELIEDYNLDANEQTIILHLLKEEIDGNSCSKDELLLVISENKFDQYRHAAYFDNESQLIRHSLIEMPERLFFDSNGGDIRLTPDIAARIINASPKTDDARIQDVLGGSDLFVMMEPRVTIDQLILPVSFKRDLQIAINQCRSEVSSVLHEWGLNSGIYSKDSQTDSDVKQAMLLLFHGAPGTGKTMAAKALANALGKKILITDVSRTLSKWVGESQQNIHRLFSKYEQIVKRTDNFPVLLLNECDQFLTKRMNTENSVDQMYNQMQNLFLEALERLQGVLIATTNLRENLDYAFSRRFHLKLEFPLPGEAERRQLWRIHLPPTLPQAKNIDLNLLAKDYPLSGGQIAVVVKNAAVEAAQSRQRLLTTALLRKYAQLEENSSFEGCVTRKKIGFSKI